MIVQWVRFNQFSKIMAHPLGVQATFT